MEDLIPREFRRKAFREQWRVGFAAGVDGGGLPPHGLRGKLRAAWRAGCACGLASNPPAVEHGHDD
jgi:hypothetical protein